MHQQKTASITPFGLYEYTIMTFGLCNCPASRQRLMQHIHVFNEDPSLPYKDNEDHLWHDPSQVRAFFYKGYYL